MSAPEDDVALRIAVAIAARAAMFLVFWLMISGRELADLPVGVMAVAAATWTSLRLLPAGRSRLRPFGLATFALRFIRQSAVSGAQVAWLAFDPRLPLRPGFVVCSLHLPAGGARSAFCALSSLLPGTLPAGADDTGALIVHCLNVDQPVVANLAADETLFIGGFGDG